MTFRDFTPEEEAVLDLIIEQREESDRDDDLFIYDVRLGQKKLNSNGNAQKYGIGLPQQHEIIRRLAEDSELAKGCIINADWIIAFDSDGTDYKFAHHNDGTWLDKTEKNYEIAPIFFSSKNERTSSAQIAWRYFLELFWFSFSIFTLCFILVAG